MKVFSNNDGVQAIIAQSAVQANRTFIAGDGFNVHEIGIGLYDFFGQPDGCRADAAILPGGQDEQRFQPVGRTAPAAQMQETDPFLIVQDKEKRMLFRRPCLQIPQSFFFGLICKTVV